MVRLYFRLMVALRSEQGSITEWLPAGMAIVAAIVVLVFVMNFLTGNLGGWINQVWGSIAGHL